MQDEHEFEQIVERIGQELPIYEKLIETMDEALTLWLKQYLKFLCKEYPDLAREFFLGMRSMLDKEPDSKIIDIIEWSSVGDIFRYLRSFGK